MHPPDGQNISRLGQESLSETDTRRSVGGFFRRRGGVRVAFCVLEGIHHNPCFVFGGETNPGDGLPPLAEYGPFLRGAIVALEREGPHPSDGHTASPLC
jgi:hypothetical protein